ncbi:MAG: type II secretion system F family protein [Candidatus Omnitrophota bacterium]|nr:type II secretion system F family protein [Candidatus Omnitrophota bacterium]
MSNYNYKARDGSGRLVKGFMLAEDEADLGVRVKKLGYFLTEAKVVHHLSKKSESEKLESRGLSRADVYDFTIQLAISLDAGVSLLTILKDLGHSALNSKGRTVISDITRRVESGCSLKEALMVYPELFSKLYVSIVDTGEKTGKLALVMSDLSRLIEWQMELKARIKEASIYPIILFVVMTIVVMVLVIAVIPKFKPMFEEMGVDLPLPTLLILGISDFMRKLWWVFLIFLVGVSWLYKFVSHNAKGRYVIDRYRLKFPLIGVLVYKIALSRFCHTFALSLRSGVDVFSSLSLASEVTGNAFLESNISKARDRINVGEKIADSMEMVGGFPNLVIRMISVGEQTGSLAETMDKVSQFYDRDVPSTIKKMFTLFEPIMILTMGVVIGGIALAVFLPMVQLISKIG